MNRYDWVVIVSPTVDFAKILPQIKQIIEKEGGKVEKENDWGVKSLSYPIDHENKARYIHFEVEISSANIGEARKRLRLNKDVLREMVTEGVGEEKKKKSRRP